MNVYFDYKSQGREGGCQTRKKLEADTDSLLGCSLRLMLPPPREPRKPSTHRTFFFQLFFSWEERLWLLSSCPGRLGHPGEPSKRDGMVGCFLRLASNHLNVKGKLGCYVHSKFPQLEMLQQICLMLMESTLYTHS